EIAQADSPTLPQYPRELNGSAGFVRKGTKGAFADHGVEALVWERQSFRVTGDELGQLGHSRSLGGLPRGGDIRRAEIETHYPAAEPIRQVDRRAAGPRRHVQHPRAGFQTQ